MSRHIKHFLPIFFKDEQWKLQLFSQWETIVGALSTKMRIEKIDQTTLLIGVYHAAWLQELYSLSHVLKCSINNHLGKNYITRITFKHATKKPPTSVAPCEQKSEKTDTISYAEKVMLQQPEQHALEKIRDKELQTILHNFLTRCYYRKIH